MATRFYLPSTGAAAVTPANDAWDKTAGASSALAAVRTRIGSAMATVTNTKDNTTLHSTLIRQYVTDPLVGQTLSTSVTVSGFIRCIESNASFSACVAISVRACSGDGGTIRSGGLMISNSDLYTGTSEMPTTTAASRAFMDVNETTAIPLGSQIVLQDGDRLIFEVGFRASDTSTTRTGGIVCGDNSATDISSSGSTTANNPWIELSATLQPYVALALTNTNVDATGAVQDLAPAAAPPALTTVAATGSVGTISAAVDQSETFAITTVLATGSPGTTLPDIAFGLITDLTSGAVGNIGPPAVALTPSGNTGAGAVESIAAVRSISLSSVASTGSVEGLGIDRSLPVSGTTSAGAVDTLVASANMSDVTVAASGVECSGVVEALARGVALVTSGVAATGAADSVGAIAQQNITLALSGNAATGDVGSVSGSLPGSAAVSGNQAQAATGNAVAKLTFSLHGRAA